LFVKLIFMPNFQSHIKVCFKSISPYVLLVGDPSRVDVVGSFLENFKVLSNTREFRLGVGVYLGKKITVCSTGIGCPATAIAAEELINAGATTLIRIGTCGGAWRSDITLGSIILPIASVRDEGTSIEYIPLGFPAVASYELIDALAKSAKKNGQKYFVGINRTHDAFYGVQNSILKWGRYLLDKRWKNYESPIISSEMECSILYIIASMRGVRAGAILAVNSEPEPLKQRLVGNKQQVNSEYSVDFTSSIISKTIKVALDAVSSFKN